MTPFDIGLFSLGLIVLLVIAGMYVPVALMLRSYGGVWLIKGSPLLAGKLMALAAGETISSYFFAVVPLFVLMGYIVSASGVWRDAFYVANALFGRSKGGLGVGTVGANAIFAAVTGISIASAAVFTKLAVPEMIRHGYTARFATGVVAGSSVLGMLIPPSLLLILYGLLTEQSVGDLFLAGVLPGLLLATFFGVGVVALATWAPGFVGRPHEATRGAMSPGEMAAKALPIAALVGLVLGRIYGGFFTPIEAGAVGALGALLIWAAKRTITAEALWSALFDTGLVTAAICFLIIAAQMYSRMLALSGAPAGFGEWVATAEIGRWGVILAYCALVIALGTILESSSIMLILAPLMLPVVSGMEVDLIWFGVVIVIAVEIGLLTPPFGIFVYVIKSTLDDDSISLGDIFLGAAPFALMMLAALGLVLVFPWLTTALI